MFFVNLRKIFLTIGIWIFIYGISWGTDGMWLPNLLKKLNEAEMKSLGMRITAEQIYSVNKGSIKDAVVHFGGGCTAEIVSSQGLLLTNHHCGYSQIQRHSSPEKNYLRDGFWAANFAEELPNPGLTVTFIRRIEDITSLALVGVRPDMSESERQSQIDKNLDDIRNSVDKEPYESIIIRPFFEGNEYYLFVTAVYKDVRLVGTPPDFIGKYGADTDNWIWPRHTGDFALFRVYAGPNNEPADYSPDNKPYRPSYHLPISIAPMKEDDFLMVLGFPGRTDQYLHSEAIRLTQHVLNPTRVEIRDLALSVIDNAMRNDPLVKIQYASKQSRISNYWKKWKGESMGLERSQAIRERRRYELEFNRRIQTEPRFHQYVGLTDQLGELYNELSSFAQYSEIYNECIIRNVEINRLAGSINNLREVYQNNGEKGLRDQIERIKSGLEAYFKDYQREIDRQVFVLMMDYYTKNMPSTLWGDIIPEWKSTFSNDWDKISKFVFGQTNLASKDELIALLEKPIESLLEAIANDPACQLVASLSTVNKKSIAPNLKDINDQIAALKRTYMKAQREVYPERRFYPDANSTMRVSYGKVKGYFPRDGIYFEPFTTVDGVLEKYIPGDYEFDLDERFRELVKNRNFGSYGENGTLIVNFIGSIHTTGGNSGSPVLNADGQLVGLLFDGAWEGVMSDIYYSEDLVRSIMVDIRYVLWVMDVYAGAKHLVKEMNIQGLN